jgi:hypothetical protein
MTLLTLPADLLTALLSLLLSLLPLLPPDLASSVLPEDPPAHRKPTRHGERGPCGAKASTPPPLNPDNDNSNGNSNNLTMVNKLEDVVWVPGLEDGGVFCLTALLVGHEEGTADGTRVRGTIVVLHAL